MRDQILYLDTEFDGFNGPLISIALVSSTGDKFYEVCEGKIFHPWALQHVKPRLGKSPLRPQLFKLAFQQFIMQFTNPTIVCDWYEDARHFFNLLGGNDYASCLKFSCHLQLLETPPGIPISQLPHNALADAEALMIWHQSLWME